MENLISSLVSWALTILTFLIVLYVALQGTAIYFTYRQKNQDLHTVIGKAAESLSSAILQVWNFISPILKSAITIAVIYYFAKSSGIFNPEIIDISKLDQKNLLAFFIIGAFSVAALMSHNPAGWLKDIALVVIGFYFGTRAGP